MLWSIMLAKSWPSKRNKTMHHNILQNTNLFVNCMCMNVCITAYTWPTIYLNEVNRVACKESKRRDLGWANKQCASMMIYVFSVESLLTKTRISQGCRCGYLNFTFCDGFQPCGSSRRFATHMTHDTFLWEFREWLLISAFFTHNPPIIT